MSNITPIRSPWDFVAAASDQIARIMDDIPGWDGYQLSAETLAELRQAGALLKQAIGPLRQARDRETALYAESAEAARTLK